jgi:hypothetical protein
VRGKLVTADPDSKTALSDPFDTLAVLDGAAGASQITLAAGGCNPDCYYDASCSVHTSGGGTCCSPIENSIYGAVFAGQCRVLNGP